MKISVKEIAEFVQAQIVGNGEVAVSGIASLHSASPQDLVFVEDAKHLRAAFTSSAAVLAGDFAEDKTSPKPLLIAKHPKLAFARAARLLYPRAGEAVGIHKSAIVDPTAILSSGVSIDARA